ncbi:SIR2 family protein [Martelella mangrovi]|uniref:Novel STAND NTPase 5 domain-containing protein n=1 Tax=Martelella mangrovi TaxID=1397477 RepID=A0ABV2IDM0_9HYPH
MFKDISKEQIDLFMSSLRHGQYSLLLGAGSSADTSNSVWRLPIGDYYKDYLCEVTRASPKHSLQRVFGLLKPNQVEEHVTNRFKGCLPGETSRNLSRFVWKRIFTWNIDDVLENTYAAGGAKQAAIPIHYSDDFFDAQLSSDLQIVHLHGYVGQPEKGYVFSREQYIKQVKDVNPWMAVLSTMMRSDPLIIAGTALDEVDLDFYLSSRSHATSRVDRGPSILVTKDDDEVISDLCKNHDLIHFVGYASDFFKYCIEQLPYAPTPEELIPQAERSLLPSSVSKAAAASFHADFSLVPASAAPALNSRFQLGHPPEWGDLAAELDVARKVSSTLVQQVEASVRDEGEPPILFIVSDDIGTGKTTIVKRSAYNLAQRGVKVLYCSALSRIATSTASVVDLIDGPVVLVVDDLADQVRAVSELIDSVEKRDFAILAAERSNRRGYLTSTISTRNFRWIKPDSTSRREIEQLIEKYRLNGNLGDHRAIREAGRFVTEVCKDPIAVACCRIMKDFTPLSRIIDDVLDGSSEQEVARYVCAALAHHCFNGGIRYDLLLGASSSTGIKSQFTSYSLLPLALAGGGRYVVPENSVIADQVLLRVKNDSPKILLAAFTGIASSIQPFVNRKTIKQRSPEARLAGRLFDYDDVVGRLLDQEAATFYQNALSEWQWNSRYWEQVALMHLAKYFSDRTNVDALEDATRRARQAVAIENHPFGLTTLGKILMTQMLHSDYSMYSCFHEGARNLLYAIEKEKGWSRKAVQPYIALFRGVITFLEQGGIIDQDVRVNVSDAIAAAIDAFPRDAETQELAARTSTFL